MDSQIDVEVIELGILHVDTLVQSYKDKLAQLKLKLEEMANAAQQLKGDSVQYFDFASDEEERANIQNCKQALESMGKTFNNAQIVSLEKEVEKLKRYADQVATAMNKDEVIKDGLKQVEKINKRLQDATNNIEQGWINFKKRKSQLKGFDLVSRQERYMDRAKAVLEQAEQAEKLSGEL